MKIVRSRLMSGCLSLILVLMIVIAGCGGGDGDVADDGGGAAQVKDGASVVRIDSGGFVEIPEGALPEGAEVSVEPMRTPVLPDGVEAVGGALAISATAELTEPATLHLPVPAGVGNASNLVIIRVEPDGTTTFLMTALEGDELVAATPGFSTFSVGELLDGRRIRLIGSQDLLPGQRALYYAMYTSMRFRPLLVSAAKWNVSGEAALISESANAAIVEAGDTPDGWATLTYEFIDLERGRRWYASRTLHVTAEPASLSEYGFDVSVITSEPTVYVGEDVRITAGAYGAVDPPITWTWKFGDGTEGGPVTTGEETTKYALPPKSYAPPAPDEEYGRREIRVTAVDSQGRAVTGLGLIMVVREPLTVALDGPQRLSWDDPGVSAQYTAVATGGEPLYRYSWSLTPGGVERNVEAFDTVEASFTSVESFTFDQPGEHRLSVRVVDGDRKEAITSLPIMVDGGEVLSTHMLDLPATAEAGDLVTVSVQVRGGVLVVSGKKAGYELHFDWGDGSETVVQEDVGLARTPYQGTVFTLSHKYSAPKPPATAYTAPVTVEVWDATGSSADDSRQITITEVGETPTPTPTPANTPPVADAKTVTTGQDTPVAITLSGSDGDGDQLSYSVESQPSHGDLSGAAPDLTYAPDSGFSGSDSFTYTVNDGETDSAAATVSITVTESANAPPVAEAITTSTSQDTPVPVTLRGTDADGDDLTYAVVGGPAHGRLSGAAPFLTYTPGSRYSGSDSFTYRVNDGRVDSAAATVDITIAPIRWVLDGGPVTNSANALTEFYGGGTTPNWFTEPRFEGKFTIYYVSETSIGMDDRDVDYGFEDYNVTVTSTFTAPPPVLNPGETVDLTATFSSSGAVTNGNPGALFEYRADRNHSGSIKPYAPLPYAPWYVNFDGTTSHTWTLTAPQGRMGDTFAVRAFWWNCTACDVIWTYVAE